jgi:hypothetical protein
LSQDTGEDGTGQFTTGQGGDVSLRKPVNSNLLHALFDERFVVADGIRSPSHANDLSYGERERLLVMLGHDCAPLCELTSRPVRDSPTIKEYPAASGLLVARHEREKSGLTRPIRADQGHELATVSREVDVVEESG